LPHRSESVLTIDLCTLYHKMAETQLRQSEPKEAPKYDRKAL
jgi:hypothetical protein